MTDMTEYQKAMDVLNDLAKEYEVWVQSDLEKLQAAFTKAKLAESNARFDIMMHEVFKTAHDMKGQGATFGYDLITDIGNHLCRYIEKQTTFDMPQIQAIQTHIDALDQIVHQHLKGQGGSVGLALKEKIEAL